MPEFEHIASGRRMTASGAEVEAAYEADGEWQRVQEPVKLTPKQQLQADAVALGLETEGTADELKARIGERLAVLREQAAELDIDGEDLSTVELAAAVDAALAK
ncbi:hypothetical protein [Actinosynnema mirum]|uniref:Uncharacterized protein n=1 Tax=Actinosynnema mirum (strain ATCC 29888 / DSM 43827 / JCM 3225 / NBRC 14064 / NCIMB 13271 / NRRL B-12336 / IMRU 3971 / 101) TaxID=446462 RepID=C6WBM5_ACTMD|nr:hypothetical protein [Actinosynnema mirum]ACU35593.1 hypothetical protein Amir_1644 [Actinosynnema mirum DSM 43827]